MNKVYPSAYPGDAQCLCGHRNVKHGPNCEDCDSCDGFSPRTIAGKVVTPAVEQYLYEKAMKGL